MGGTSNRSALILVAAAASAGTVQAIACSVELELENGKAPTRIQLLPMGSIVMRDGRGPYRIRDIGHAAEIVEATRKYFGSADMPGDRDHQMLHAVKPGKGGTAPATAWVKTAMLSAEADGIWANGVEWTPAAAAQIESREYRYISPLFFARPVKDGGDVIQLKNFALVNMGAIDLPAIAAGLSEEEDHMDLTAIAAALGLSATATVEEIAAAIGEINQKPATSAIAIAAGLAETATVEEIAAAVGSIRKPDMSGFVPLSVVAPMRDQLKKLNEDRLGRQVDELVAAGVVLPAKRKETLDWFEKDEVAAAAFFKDMPPIVPPGAQLGDRKPAEKATTLSAEEVAACAATGMSHEDFLKAKNEEIA